MHQKHRSSSELLSNSPVLSMNSIESHSIAKAMEYPAAQVKTQPCSSPKRDRQPLVNGDKVSEQSIKVQDKKSTLSFPCSSVLNRLQLPTLPRRVPFIINDPQFPQNSMASLHTISGLFQYRKTVNPDSVAFITLDNKGREVACCTWSRLYDRAEKLAMFLSKHAGIKSQEIVILYYRRSEFVDYISCFLACMLVGIIVVPVMPSLSFQDFLFILSETQSKHVMLTESTFKIFIRETSIGQRKDISWWKINEVSNFKVPPGVLSLNSNEDDIAYIDFIKPTVSSKKAIVFRNKTIMSQVKALTTALITNPLDHGIKNYKTKRATQLNVRGEVLLTYLDPRRSVGLTFTVWNALFSGYTSVICEPEAISTAGTFAFAISKYQATMLLCDYNGLKNVVFNYQEDPRSTLSYRKKFDVNFSLLKLCLIHCNIVDPEFNALLSDRWLRPLGCLYSRDIVAPLLTLDEYGGISISMKDWLMVNDTYLTNGPMHEDFYQELLVLKQPLWKNTVHTISFLETCNYNPEDILCLSPFWLPIINSSVVVVNPNSHSLCKINEIGELWVQSKCLPTELFFDNKFHNCLPEHPIIASDNESESFICESSFFRTNIYGFLREGHIIVVGRKEDQIRQNKHEIENGKLVKKLQLFYSQFLIRDLMKRIPNIHEAVLFDIKIEDDYYPVLIIETTLAEPAQHCALRFLEKDFLPIFEELAQNCCEYLNFSYKLSLYAVFISRTNKLPRNMETAGSLINPHECRHEFLLGTLPTKYVKFFVDRAISCLPVGKDIVHGIWSSEMFDYYNQQQESKILQKNMFTTKDIEASNQISDRLLLYNTILDLFLLRVSKTPLQTSFVNLSSKLTECSEISWRKVDYRIASIMEYIQLVLKPKPSQIMLLIYEDPMEFVFALYSCFFLGITVIPFQKIGNLQLQKEIGLIIRLIDEFKVTAILIDESGFLAWKSKPIIQAIKQRSSLFRTKMPKTLCTTGIPLSKKSTKHLRFRGIRELIKDRAPAVIWINRAIDGIVSTSSFCHFDLIQFCKELKEAFHISSTDSLMAGFDFSHGLGLVLSSLMGIYCGFTTFLLTEDDLSTRFGMISDSLLKHKISHMFLPKYLLYQFIKNIPDEDFTFIHALIVPFSERLYSQRLLKIKTYLNDKKLAIDAIYFVLSHAQQPILSYINLALSKNDDIVLSLEALREGLVKEQSSDVGNNLLLTSAGEGMHFTDICVVHPEKRVLLTENRIGEIWYHGPHGAACNLDRDGFGFPIESEGYMEEPGMSHKCFLRTGLLGFLSRPHNQGSNSDSPLKLYVLGNIWDTLEINGLNHFVIDIEQMVERCHSNISKDGCVLFQAGENICLLVEVKLENCLATLAALIVTKVLSVHKFILDNIAFVHDGSFPRNYLGIKNRQKIIELWLKRKMKLYFELDTHFQQPFLNDLEEEET
ncbi:AMP binding enzyme [Schizosaccharomyces japonicus yFS275]|uniref:AMP binding enzyme n=1 Tax=Schizosaccharomyces japonicus (strain yFS275 / FY16936) TaxID=402676 RepID=B6JX54_SCHJY|nr:AMP binding enzyme [Schizosaccharomyces japonicus yFS275]EEB05955.1 AMP binding enzyme [Schizosaccharomyces japonicus yFS275]